MKLRNIAILGLILLGGNLSCYSMQNNNNQEFQGQYSPPSLQDLAKKQIAKDIDNGRYENDNIGDVPDHLKRDIESLRTCPSENYIKENLKNISAMNPKIVHNGKVFYVMNI